MTTHLLAVRVLGWQIDTLWASILAAGLLFVGLSIWWKFDKAIVGVPMVAAAAYLGWLVFHSII